MKKIADLKPNTRCKNPNCKHGPNNSRKIYYTCKFCLHEENFKSIACCIDCYNEYISIVEEKRSKNLPISLTPERTDITQTQYTELMQAPIEQVKEETIAEITNAGYGETLEQMGLSKTLEKINEDIDKSESIKNEESINNEESIQNKVNDKPVETKRSRRSKYHQ